MRSNRIGLQTIAGNVMNRAAAHYQVLLLDAANTVSILHIAVLTVDAMVNLAIFHQHVIGANENQSVPAAPFHFAPLDHRVVSIEVVAE